MSKPQHDTPDNDLFGWLGIKKGGIVMLKAFCACILVLIMATMAVADIYPRIVEVRGNKLVWKDDGQVAMFRGFGMDEAREDIVARKYWPSGWVGKAINAMRRNGATIVRINAIPLKARQLGVDNYVNEISTYVSEAEKRHMYVMISFHTEAYMPTLQFAQNWYPEAITCTKEDFWAFWDAISKKFCDNKVVAFYELINEATKASPTSSFIEDWGAWKDFCDDAVARIRTNDPSKIILISGLNWANKYDATRPIAGTNIGYNNHPYPWQGGDGPSRDGIVNLSHKHDPIRTIAPMVASELCYWTEEEAKKIDPLAGLAEISWPGPGRYRDAICNYLEQRQIPWIIWNFREGYHDLSWICNSDSNEFKMNEQGQFWADKMIPFAPKGKVTVTTNDVNWRFFGDTAKHKSGETVDIVANATYTIIPDNGSPKTVEVHDGETVSVNVASGGSTVGGGGCRFIDFSGNTILLALIFILLQNNTV